MVILLDGKPDPELLVRIINDPTMALNFSDATALPNVERITQVMMSPDCAIGLWRDEGGMPLGFYVIRWLNSVTIKLSGGFLPAARGKVAKEALSILISALFFRGAVVKIVGEVCECNRASMQMAGALGFKREGLNRQSVMVAGKLRDQVHFGLMRSEWNGPGLRHQS